MKISKKLPFRLHTFSLLCFTALALTGCMRDDLAMDDAMVSKPYAGSKAFPISVEKGPISLEVSSAHGTLQPAQINAVSAFASQAMQAGVTPVTINRPSGGGASARVASEIAAVMAQQGLTRNMLRVATYSGPVSGPVVVSYVSTFAKTKKCGDWPDDASETDLNEHLSSHGCAVQANIAAMVANPETLVVPSAKTPIVASTRSVGTTSLNTRQITYAAGNPITTQSP